MRKINNMNVINFINSDHEYSNFLNKRILLLSLLEINLDKKVILDFGCQHGTSVEYLRSIGLNVFGFDVGDAKNKGIIRRSNLDNYKIPFPDNYFDIIFSHHVFEHISDYDTALYELNRILKPSGSMIHVFPSRLRLFEAHFYTPLGGIFHSKMWCTFWSWLKKPGRKNIGFFEYGKLASETISKELNYLNRNTLNQYFQKYFFEIKSSSVMYANAITGNRFPFILETVLSNFHARVFIIKGKKIHHPIKNS